jgi:hypothetical protein
MQKEQCNALIVGKLSKVAGFMQVDIVLPLILIWVAGSLVRHMTSPLIL